MKCPRLFGLLVVNLLLIGLIGLLYPQQLPVSLYKLSLVTLAGLVGYWLDRALFPYARPSGFVDSATPYDERAFECDVDAGLLPGEHGAFELSLMFVGSMIRRAMIVSAAMLAMGLGA